ncbi:MULTISPECIES: hypothetical protein, partial [unclassified Acinetobacter]|uniref:hypothetical protein n=1 Tax=unclassified Acinetobacter TaxID=196816 RepID=UPI001C555358
SARDSCPVCFHAMSVSFVMWLIIKHYIILTNFCVSVRAKVSMINSRKKSPYLDELFSFSEEEYSDNQLKSWNTWLR